MNDMKPTDGYLLLFRGTDWYDGLPDEKVREIVTNWMDWYARLTKSGVVASGSPLAPEGKIVGGINANAISDGPFAEAKETVGGYFVVRAKSIDEAVAVAKQCPGIPYGVRVEVRPMLETCAVDKHGAAGAKLATA